MPLDYSSVNQTVQEFIEDIKTKGGDVSNAPTKFMLFKNLVKTLERDGLLTDSSSTSTPSAKSSLKETTVASTISAAFQTEVIHILK